MAAYGQILEASLRERRDIGPYLFTGRKGPLQKRQVQELFTDYARTAGIKARSVHALRHSMAVHGLQAGRGIEYVADHLGHKNIQDTRIYAQITRPLRDRSSASSSSIRSLSGFPNPAWLSLI